MIREAIWFVSIACLVSGYIYLSSYIIQKFVNITQLEAYSVSAVGVLAGAILMLCAVELHYRLSDKE